MENRLHLRRAEGFGEIVKVPRIFDDDRGRRVCDVFGTVTGDLNITYAYPGVITAWHAHQRQTDEWFVIKGSLKIGLAKLKAGVTAAEAVAMVDLKHLVDVRFVTLSEWDRVVLRIAPGTLHGWHNFTPQEAILLYHISEKHDPSARTNCALRFLRLGPTGKGRSSNHAHARGGYRRSRIPRIRPGA